MEGRIDVLTHQGLGAPYFVVDKAAVAGYVPLLTDPLYDYGKLYSSLSVTGFERGDSFLLLSYGFELPYGFEVIPIDMGVTGYAKNLMNFHYLDNGVEKLIPENHKITYPLGGNYELSHGGWFDFPKSLVVASSFELLIHNVGLPYPMRVSMYSVPADLDGKKFYTPFWIKIAHTSPLVTV